MATFFLITPIYIYIIYIYPFIFIININCNLTISIYLLYIYFCISNCINNDSFFVIYLTKLLLFWYFHGKNILFFIQFILTTIHFIYNLHPEKHHCLVFLLFCYSVLLFFSYYLVSQKRCNNREIIDLS